ncbi:NapC/NirT family cytochrome c [Mangrovibacterium marinum]|uniref:Cytochrome c nitrite reductase small subunit n=1 Tax=Mangrovibacterium marinum TaxID=1639118 RepID=A0A2T5C0R7_9BACT|nr:NapC/NirT family cytochrome c [Mangrovibacterium marinum]PTN08197.1 cytochrome c nitrite reductase small subunit [Mangrovibacterium marinum]
MPGRYKGLALSAILIAVLYLLYTGIRKGDAYTSTNEYCNSCHVHNHNYSSWNKSIHHRNDSVKAGCVDCHLPPRGQGYYQAKIKAGLNDLYAYHFKDHDSIDWLAKSQTDQAQRHVFKNSCIQCHPDLFPQSLSEKGQKGHLKYHLNPTKMHCIECHLHTGHTPDYKSLIRPVKTTSTDTIYQHSHTIKKLANFTETIPNSRLSFTMIAIPGGATTFRENNQQTEINISAFFIGEIEVSWNLYLLFLSETEGQGRNEKSVDGISGATPPWGNPDQGWGMGSRPAITMTHHAATVFCQWLSQKTGKSYRLPTEAEWERAAQMATKDRLITKETANYDTQSTIEPSDVNSDAIGARNLFGNVKEFCADSYTEDRMSYYSKFKNDPVILDSLSAEHVIKGGSFKSDRDELRPTQRESTQTERWLRTDPQMPKSIWWYSDCNDVGFRVVLPYQPE